MIHGLPVAFELNVNFTIKPVSDLKILLQANI